LKSRRMLGLVLALVCVGAGTGLLVSRLRAHPPPVSAIVVSALMQEETVPYTATASLSMPYQGRMVKSTISIIHSHDAEKISRPSKGDGPWSIKDARGSCAYCPKSNRLVVNRWSSMLTPEERGRLLLANYDPRYEGSERVAGRDAYVIELVPKHQGRASKKIWVDVHSQTVLRSIDRSCDGEERGMEITDIHYTAGADKAAFTPHPKAGAKTLISCKPADPTTLDSKVGVHVTLPAYIPSGFKLEGRHLFTPPCGCCPICGQLTYTDGLCVISVFQSRPDTKCTSTCCGPKAARPGTYRATCCGITGSGRITRKDKTIVVIADLPPTELRKIAESVK